MNFIKTRRNSFALVYTLVIVLIISFTIAAISVSTLSDMRQTKKNFASTGVYQIARAGIEDGIIRWDKKDKNHCNDSDQLKGIALDGSKPELGSYDLKICDDGGDNRYIESIGYLGDDKIKLHSEHIVDCPGCTGYDLFQTTKEGF